MVSVPFIKIQHYMDIQSRLCKRLSGRQPWDLVAQTSQPIPNRFLHMQSIWPGDGDVNGTSHKCVSIQVADSGLFVDYFFGFNVQYDECKNNNKVFPHKGPKRRWCLFNCSFLCIARHCQVRAERMFGCSFTSLPAGNLHAECW